MRLLANENYSRASVLALRNNWYDIVSIREDNPSIKDHKVIDITIKEERLILTFDRNYGELVFKKGLKPNNGILYLRIDIFAPGYRAEIINKLISSQKFNFERHITVVDN